MGLKEVASAASLWRGWDYYKENRVLKWEQTGENTYDGILKLYAPMLKYINLLQLRKSTTQSAAAGETAL